MELNHMFEGDTEVSPRPDNLPEGSIPRQLLGEDRSLVEHPENKLGATSFMDEILKRTNAVLDDNNAPIETTDQKSASLEEAKPIIVSQERVNYCVRTIQALAEEGNVRALEQISEEVEAQRSKLGMKSVELVERIRSSVDEVRLASPSSGGLPATHFVATRTEQWHSTEVRDGLPAWFLDLKTKLEDGTIPRYAGKWHDGDPVDFLLSYYKDVVDARILTQAHLKALDRKLYDSVKHTYRNSGRELAELLPVAVVFSKKFMN